MSTSAILWFAMLAVAPAAEGSVGVEAKGPAAQGGDEAPKPGRSRDRADQPWIRRWAPERNTVDLGAAVGVIFPHPRLELFEATFDRPNQGFVPLRRVAPEFGVRVGYYPWRILGAELEGMAMPSRTTTDQSALLWGVRGQVVGQLPWWSVTPFVLAGISGLGVISDPVATLLLDPTATTTQGWVLDQSYSVTIDFTDAGSTVSVVRDSDGVELASFDVTDTTYTTGYFGSTTASQQGACVGPLFAECL